MCRLFQAALIDGFVKTPARFRGRDPGGFTVQESDAPKALVIRNVVRVNPAGAEGKRHVLPWEVSASVWTNQTTELATVREGCGEVSRSHSSRWSNDHPGRLGKPSYRAKGRTDKELSDQMEDSAARQPTSGEKPERMGQEGRRPDENIRGVKDRYQTRRRERNGSTGRATVGQDV